MSNRIFDKELFKKEVEEVESLFKRINESIKDELDDANSITIDWNTPIEEE